MELEYTTVSKDMVEFIPNTSRLPELLGRRIGYSNPKYPGFYHIHTIQDYSVVFLDEESCKEFDLTLEEIKASGPMFQEYVTHPEDLERVRQELLDFAIKQDEMKILTYFYRLRLKKEDKEGYTLVVTSVRLDLDQQTFICITNTTDQLPVFTKKICNTLNVKYETKKYIDKYLKLTKREKEIFLKLVKGWTVKEIANNLIRSIRTIEQHKKNIYKKLEVKSLTQIVQIGYFLNL
ncbi:LuxR C-terminal-related transcriptional regulator [Aquimarina longa]|uniref:LuxR C-terminal-related transcriptional regulator n=1 Tax=Aquimarina longa TaxID=1080221 RepID=UPI0007841E2A|nr:LuxR C-terminal-related transcriptional regulator [Aquimarina longa]